eukprot:1159494-Pelagomonas_calceolata.AAC.3
MFPTQETGADGSSAMSMASQQTIKDASGNLACLLDRVSERMMRGRIAPFQKCVCAPKGVVCRKNKERRSSSAPACPLPCPSWLMLFSFQRTVCPIPRCKAVLFPINLIDLRLVQIMYTTGDMAAIRAISPFDISDAANVIDLPWLNEQAPP